VELARIAIARQRLCFTRRDERGGSKRVGPKPTKSRIARRRAKEERADTLYRLRVTTK
jgi:hypothetical protein